MDKDSNYKDSIIVAVITTALLEDDCEYDELMIRHLRHPWPLYCEEEARSIIESVREFQRNRKVDIAKWLADSRDIFVIRLFACLNARIYKEFLDYGAPKEAFHAIGLVWKKISDEIDQDIHFFE